MISFRRYYLDSRLKSTSFSGQVLDIGGKKKNPRGEFRPPAHSVTEWKYVNIDAITEPDYLASADKLPLSDRSVDQALLCELVEHVENPERVLSEAHRVLRPKGFLVLTMPFLFSVHGDPVDFQRWTPVKIENELKRAGFSQIQIEPMGGFIAVICDLFEMWCHLVNSKKGKNPLWQRGIRFLYRRGLSGLLIKLDDKFQFKNWITTGYFVTAKKT